MRSITAILFFSWFIFPVSLAQGELDLEDKIFYRNENTYAITLNSNGYGLGYRHAKRVDAFKKITYEIEYAIIKHQKEEKRSSLNSQQIGGSFVYGKLNSYGTLRGGVGIQKELFRKVDRGGVSIRYFYNFGASLGIQKPVYYEIYKSRPGTDTTTSVIYKDIMKFESHINFGSISRKLPYYKGFNELSVVPGAYAKIGFTFEFGKNDAVFNALEAGVLVDAFIKKVPIMANELNNWLYPAFYVSYRFGKVVNAQFKTKLNKVDKVLLD